MSATTNTTLDPSARKSNAVRISPHIGLLRSVQRYVGGYSDAEKKARRATSNAYEHPTNSQLEELVQLTRDTTCWIDILRVLDCRLKDDPQQWRRIIKASGTTALTLMELIVCTGPLSVIDDLVARQDKVKDVARMAVVLERGTDRTPGLRKRAAQLLKLLTDPDALAAARHRAVLLYESDAFTDVNPLFVEADITPQISSVSPQPCKYGGLSDVYDGIFSDNGKVIKVAIKVIRPTSVTSERHARRHLREVTVWREITHDHLLPLYGLYVGFGRLPAMVSPWCENGDITSYTASKKLEWQERVALLVQVLEGLRYLHDYAPVIVHGDIKGANVLVSATGVACLADFGFASVLVDLSLSTTTQTSVKGTLRWMAPELLTVDNGSPTTQSDIWAYGCLMFEVLGERLPYHAVRNEQAVVLALSRYQPPAVISDWPEAFPIGLWNLMNDCWSHPSWDRPSAEHLFDWLRAVPANHLLASLRYVDGLMTESQTQLLNYVASSEFGGSCLSQLDFTLALLNILTLCQTHKAVPDTPSRLLISNMSALAAGLRSSNRAWTRAPISRFRHFARSLSEAAGPAVSSDILKVLSSPLIAAVSVSSRPIQSIYSGFNGYDILAADCLFLSRWRVQSSISYDHAELVPLRGVDSDGTVLCLDLSPSALVAVAYSSGVWKQHYLQVATSRISIECSSISAVSLSPNSGQVAAATSHQLLLWDPIDQELHVMAKEPTTSVSFSPDGSFIASGHLDGTVCVWSVSPIGSVQGPLGGSCAAVTSLAFSRDQKYIVSGSTDFVVRLWRTETGACISNLTGHRGTITCLSFAPDSGRFASGSRDGSVIIWDATLRKAVGRVWCHSLSVPEFTLGDVDTPIGYDTADPFAVTALSWSPDGRRILSGSFDGAIRIWDATGAWRTYDPSSDVWGNVIESILEL